MNTTAVILAAGFSSRMGKPNKLLLDVDGKPILRGIAEAVSTVTDRRPTVVLGHDADRVRDALSGLDLSFVLNDAPEQGQRRSVTLGLSAAARADTVLVALGDQPLLTASLLSDLLIAHHAQLAVAGGLRITVPVRGETRGNPIVIPRPCLLSILSGGQNLGCGGFTRKHPELVHRYETSEPAFFLDVDTPEDLAWARAMHVQRKVA